MEIREFNGAPTRAKGKCSVCGRRATNVIEVEHETHGREADLYACDRHLMDVTDHILRTKAGATSVERARALDVVDAWDQRWGHTARPRPSQKSQDTP